MKDFARKYGHFIGGDPVAVSGPVRIEGGRTDRATLHKSGAVSMESWGTTSPILAAILPVVLALGTTMGLTAYWGLPLEGAVLTFLLAYIALIYVTHLGLTGGGGERAYSARLTPMDEGTVATLAAKGNPEEVVPMVHRLADAMRRKASAETAHKVPSQRRDVEGAEGSPRVMQEFDRTLHVRDQAREEEQRAVLALIEYAISLESEAAE